MHKREVCRGWIYRHWIINDKGMERSYIGRCVRSPKGRWGTKGQGYTDYKHEDGTKFCRAIRKYGWENFHHDIIGYIECETKEELNFWLNEWEQYYIWYYDSFHNGYNSTLGGDGSLGRKVSEKTREKMSKLMKGRKRNPESVEKSARSRIGTKQSEATKAKISAGNKGRKVSDEAKKKMSLAKKGKPGTFIGKKHKESTKQKISEKAKARARKVRCVNTGEVFMNAKAAADYAGVVPENIRRCCSGRNASSGKHPITGEKLVWEWILEEEGNDSNEL